MRKLLRVSAVLVLVLAALFVAGNGLVEQRVAKAVGTAAARALGVETRVDAAVVRLPSGHLVLADVAVRNPGGYRAPDLLTVRSVRLETTLGALRDDPLVADRLVVEGVSLDVVYDPEGSNLGQVLDAAERFARGAAPADPAEPARRLHVARIEVRDAAARIEVTLSSGERSTVALTLPALSLPGVGDASVADVVDVIVQALARALLEAGAEALPPEVRADLAHRLERRAETATAPAEPRAAGAQPPGVEVPAAGPAPGAEPPGGR